MFTGIIKEVGKILSLTTNKEGMLIEIEAKQLLSEISIDDSVSINGVCQTAISKSKNSFRVQAVKTTLEKTTFNQLSIGKRVNLELALRPLDRLGGHFLSGHVNGVACVDKLSKTGNASDIWLAIAPDFFKYFIREGSIALDGISLTIADIDAEQHLLMVSIIPHTVANTIILDWQKGTKVNFEVDILAKYIENLLFYRSERNNGREMTTEWIKSKGF